MLEVRFGTIWCGRVSDTFVSDFVIDWQPGTDGTLVVLLNHAALAVLSEDESVAGCVWRLDGREYQTMTVTPQPARGLLRVMAREAPGA